MPLELFSRGLIGRPSEMESDPGSSCLGHGLEASRPLSFHVYSPESHHGAGPSWLLAPLINTGIFFFTQWNLLVSFASLSGSRQQDPESMLSRMGLVTA